MIVDKEKLKEYTKSYLELKKMLKSVSSEESIAIFQIILKDRRELQTNIATIKQKAFMSSLGIKFDDNITKEEARKKIDNHLKGANNEENKTGGEPQKVA